MEPTNISCTIVLFLAGHAGDAAAAALLGLIGGLELALDVAVLGQGEDALLLLDQVLDVDLVLHVLDLGLALVAVLVAQLRSARP